MVLQGWAQAPGVAPLVLLTQKLRGEVPWGQGLDLCGKEMVGGGHSLADSVFSEEVKLYIYIYMSKEARKENPLLPPNVGLWLGQ